MSSGLFDWIAIRLGISKPHVTTDINGLLLLCDKQDNIMWWLHASLWATLVIQAIFVLVLPPTPLSNLCAVLVAFMGLVILRGYVDANNTVRSMVLLSQTMHDTVRQQNAAMEAQTECIRQQDEVIEQQHAVLKQYGLEGLVNYRPGASGDAAERH